VTKVMLHCSAQWHPRARFPAQPQQVGSDRCSQAAWSSRPKQIFSKALVIHGRIFCSAIPHAAQFRACTSPTNRLCAASYTNLACFLLAIQRSLKLTSLFYATCPGDERRVLTAIGDGGPENLPPQPAACLAQTLGEHVPGLSCSGMRWFPLPVDSIAKLKCALNTSVPLPGES
jgi:hypothetical protein